MTRKRSYRHFVLGSLGVALMLANCTVKEDSDESCEKGDRVNGCECPGNVTGHQICGSDGVFGSCQCPDGSAGSGNASGNGSGGGGEDEGGAPSGGTPSAGTGGTGGASAGAGGAPEGGMDGAGGEPALTCDACLEALCGDELEACASADDDELCITQYLNVMDCIERDRAAGNNVSRDRLRGCGVSLGASPEPDLTGAWAPPQMADQLTDLLNCMATSAEVVPPNGDWADVSGPNFPDDGPPTPWPADSCAKLACTSPE